MQKEESEKGQRVGLLRRYQKRRAQLLLEKLVAFGESLHQGGIASNILHQP
jgi:hypothetical protein